ncbi:UDP-N-acetylmuramoyl-L-alanyl-D-glutamate--2,6-diaminopimelate ligase [Luteococcus peritonei]|uniref:UDP-N-acetylmuramoyl-L-alanyl-D-glutamate--2,6-diaminopimelate ligase n=1 Tax=Luteococcus peritonei TaxID=88874 RepID=A0ABW4RRG6_9ACTN
MRLPEQAGAVEVSGITLDSRTVRPGDLYVALPGSRVHGARFAEATVAAGAVAVLTDPTGAELAAAAGLPVVVADDARDAMADAAATLFGRPTHELMMYGITGTNGKTTTAFLLEAALEACGRRVGTIGTIGFRLDGAELPSNRTTVTTPESPDLQALLAVMLERGADSVAMEVSSHALALQRVDHIGFDIAAFTNLGRDHLDFHPTVADYFEAKARLFQPEWCRVAVVNTDDEHGQELARRLREQGSPRLVSTGFGESDHRLLEVRPEGPGMFVRCQGPYGERSFTIDLPGEHNARNAVMALAMASEAGLDADAAIEGLRHAQVPGRMQLVRLEGSRPDGRGAPRVHVDFAHTPQAISSALAAAHPGPGGRVLAVLGAGGDRDAAKREPMGRAAAEGAQVVVVTDDNPRNEDPDTIRAAVLAGARAVDGVELVEQAGRSAAIRTALSLAGPQDVLLVLGKGHEKGQIIAEKVHRFDDVEQVRTIWNALRLVGDAPAAEEDTDAQH